jgi:phosphinothricin acetyltransferase
MTIRIATPEDFSNIAAIYNEYIQLGNATMEERIHEEKDIAAWVKKFNARERLYVMEVADEVIGWGIIKKYSDRDGYRFAAETAVYLTSSQLGKGYGSDMKKYLMEQARLLEYRHLIAKIFAENKASVQYNLKLGYTLVGTQKNIGFKNGEWKDIVILQLLLY